jgi:hypothetical protein
MPSRKTSRSAAVAVRQPKKKARPLEVQAAPLSDGPYSMHPGVAMFHKWIAELKGKTGRTLDEWVKHILAAGPRDQQACRAWLQQEYGVGANSAGWLAEKTFGNKLSLADESPAAYLAACPKYVAQMYSGAKACLRPLHDELVRLVKSIGDEVKVCPCPASVPLYRKHAFAEIKPATSRRIDLGLALGDEPFTSRLVDTGGKANKQRLTHKVAIASLSEIDLQVRRWLREACERDA